MTRKINVSMGSKIKGSDFEGQLIYWIIENPSISNHALSVRLKEELDIKVSSPTVKAWRENYFPTDKEFLKTIEETFKTRKDNIDKFNKSLASKVRSTVDIYLTYASVIEDKIKDLEEIQKSRDKENKALSLEIERTIIQYWRLLDTIRSKAYNFTGGAEYVQQLQDLITEVAAAAIKVFYPNVKDSEKDKVKLEFKRVIDKIEESLYDTLPKVDIK